MNSFRTLVLTLLLLLPFCASQAQLVVPDSLFHPKEEVVIAGKRFRVWNNYMTIGAGLGYHTANPHTQIPFSLNFNFHIRQHYFRLGGDMSGDRLFSDFNHYQLYGGYVLRKQTQYINKSLCLGLSYVTGYNYLYYLSMYDNKPFTRTGLYAEAQLIKKVAYDLGYGGAVFADINDKYTITGLRFELYFSSAYRGYTSGYRGPKKGQY